jgi:flagellin
MSFSVVTNLASLNAQAQLGKTNMSLDKAIARLTSGLRINTAADDAAGMAIANRHKLDYSGLQTGIRSANDAISKLQIEDGAMTNIASLLDRALTLAAQAASDTFLGDRDILQTELDAVIAEIDRTAKAAGVDASGGATAERLVFVGNTQILDDDDDVTYVTVDALADPVDASGLAVAGMDISDQSGAADAVGTIQEAITTLGIAQGQIGAGMTRLQFAISQAETLSVNVAAAESRLRDANMAEEASNLTKYNILTQSGIAALAQANSAPGAVLRLLQ